jgi:hypothetical protein
MNPLAVVLLAGPLIAFVTAINFALLHGDEWRLSDIAGGLTLAAVIGAACARIDFAALIGLPFLTPGIGRRGGVTFKAKGRFWR